MTAAGWTRVRDLFDAALDRPAAERSAFLDEQCRDDPALRAEVNALLLAHEQAGDFIEAPAYQTHADLLDDGPPVTKAGQTLGPYVVHHEIGRGGMGIVYLADDTRLSRRVALKALSAHGRSNAANKARIRTEARAAAALSHPGIATVYALEEIDDELYNVAFEYVPGPTLRTLTQAGRLPVPEAVDIAAQLAHALAAAHAQGVVHRDLKPENAIRTAAGVVKILDFGIARIQHDSSARLTDERAAIGTPAYMSPEQLRGDDVDFRSDLYSFGLLIHELVSGALTFDVNAPSTGAPALDRILARCLRPHPGDRYRSTLELALDLDRLQASISDEGLPGPSTSLTPRWWWQMHQAAVSVVYGLMLYPAWRARTWLAPPLGRLFFFAMLGWAAAAASIRLHLWFTSRFNAGELDVQRSRLRAWTRATDVGFAITLLPAGIGISENHPEIATLFVAVAIVATAASFIIEPATSAAAFRDYNGSGRL